MEGHSSIIDSLWQGTFQNSNVKFYKSNLNIENYFAFNKNLDPTQWLDPEFFSPREGICGDVKRAILISAQTGGHFWEEVSRVTNLPMCTTSMHLENSRMPVAAFSQPKTEIIPCDCARRSEYPNPLC